MPEAKTTKGVDLAKLLRSPKRKKFVIAYCENGGNGTAAAESAGFEFPEQEAVRLLKDAKVIEAIEQYSGVVLAVAGETHNTILQRTINRAKSDIGDYFETTGDVTGALKPLHKLTKEQRQCIKKLSWNQHGPVLELHDPSAADAKLAEYMGMTKREDEALTADDAASLIAAAMDRMDAVDAA